VGVDRKAETEEVWADGKKEERVCFSGGSRGEINTRQGGDLGVKGEKSIGNLHTSGRGLYGRKSELSKKDQFPKADWEASGSRVLFRGAMLRLTLGEPDE